MTSKQLEESQKIDLLNILKSRFENNIHRHPSIEWSTIEAKLMSQKSILPAVFQMESSGGEPDIILLDNNTLTYCDCSKESPKNRRSLCYDYAAWAGRKENKPVGNVIDLATEMGIQILTETQYKELQEVEEFDLKTSSWLLTPPAIRDKKGAIFGDRRYDRVFIYHNGAESYYAARGFRGYIVI